MKKIIIKSILLCISLFVLIQEANASADPFAEFEKEIDSFEKITCPSDKPALWTDGKCYTCNEIKNKLDKMPKRVTMKNEEGIKFFITIEKLEESCPEAVSSKYIQ